MDYQHLEGVTFRPLTTWPGDPLTPDGARRRSQFKAGIGATERLLSRELHMLRAGPTVVELAIDASEFRRDGLPYARAVARHPGIVLSITASKHGALRYATDVFDRWQDNLRAIAMSLEALRQVDRYGVARRGEQYRGWLALGAGSGDVERGGQIVAAEGGATAALRATHPDTRTDGYTEDDYAAVLAWRENSRHTVLT